jgi:hypothetical protein
MNSPKIAPIPFKMVLIVSLQMKITSQIYIIIGEIIVFWSHQIILERNTPQLAARGCAAAVSLSVRLGLGLSQESFLIAAPLGNRVILVQFAHKTSRTSVVG